MLWRKAKPGSVDRTPPGIGIEQPLSAKLAEWRVVSP